MRFSIALLLLLLITACTSADKALSETDFAVTVKILDNELKANQDIALVPELTNLSNQRVTIVHAAPLIHVQIYDEQHQPLLEEVTLTIAITHELKPNEPYISDSRPPSGKKVVRIEKPGKYTLVGTAIFSIESDDGNQKNYEIARMRKF